MLFDFDPADVYGVIFLFGSVCCLALVIYALFWKR